MSSAEIQQSSMENLERRKMPKTNEELVDEFVERISNTEITNTKITKKEKEEIREQVFEQILDLRFNKDKDKRINTIPFLNQVTLSLEKLLKEKKINQQKYNNLDYSIRDLISIAALFSLLKDEDAVDKYLESSNMVFDRKKIIKNFFTSYDDYHKEALKQAEEEKITQAAA